MVYLSELVVLLCTFYTLINAAPQSTIVKRTNPILGQAIDRNDPRRGGKLVPRPGKPATGAFSNVQQMIDDILFDGSFNSHLSDENLLRFAIFRRRWHRQ